MRQIALFLALVCLAARAADDGALKKALAEKNMAQVYAASEELLKQGTPAAVETVVKLALKCDHYDTEKRIAGLLGDLPPELREPVRKEALGSSSYQVRIILAAVLASYDDAESFTALCTLVHDTVPSVQLAAISRMVAKRNVRVIDYFVEEYAKLEKQGGVVAADLREALKRMTGEDYTRGEDWKKWWNTRRASFKLDDVAKAPPSRGRTVVAGRAEFFGNEIVSNKILFVLDMSDSMKKRDPLPEKDEKEDPERGSTVVKKKKKKEKEEGDDAKVETKLPITRERLYRVQQELKKTIDALPPETKFTIMAFNNEIKWFNETPQPASGAFKRKAKGFVDSFKPEGLTHTDDALKAAFNIKDKIDTIYLLSDGAPRRLIEKGKQKRDELIPIEPILKMVKEANRFRKIKIFTVGFEQAGGNLRRFMRELAQQNDGEYKGLE